MITDNCHINKDMRIVLIANNFVLFDYFYRAYEDFVFLLLYEKYLKNTQLHKTIFL